jgi:hypothetical protein
MLCGTGGEDRGMRAAVQISGVGSSSWNGWLWTGVLAAALLAPTAARAETTPAQTSAQLPAEVTAGSGDSWLSLRSKLCPVESIQTANPNVSSRSLKLGDVVRSPFILSSVHAAEVERARVTRTDLEGRLEEERTRTAALEAQLKPFEEVKLELVHARESEQTWKTTSGGALAAAAIAAALLVASLFLALAARTDASRLKTRLAASDERYGDLRRSLQSLEVQLQKRMLDMLEVHKSQPPTERDVEEATLPVIEMAERIKQRHAS